LTYFLNYGTPSITFERMKLNTSLFVRLIGHGKYYTTDEASCVLMSSSNVVFLTILAMGDTRVPQNVFLVVSGSITYPFITIHGN